MQNFLIVVDMQKDFIDGALGSAEAEAVVPRVRAKIDSFCGRVIYTRDTHDSGYSRTQEGRRLPVAHCIRETKGWQITLVGLCTDICVISNALLVKAFLPEAEIVVDAACCAGVTPESHKTALQAMKSCQITIENDQA